MSVEQHLVRLQQIGSDQKGTAVRQLDVGDLQLRALTEVKLTVLPIRFHATVLWPILESVKHPSFASDMKRLGLNQNRCL